MKNFTLSFWDASDNFKFEKVINTSLVAPDYQMNIWYIEFLDSWATTDKTGALHVWDIGLNRVRNSYYITGEIKKEYNNVYGNSTNQGADPSSMATSMRGKAKSFKSMSTFKNKDIGESPSQSNKHSQRHS